MSQDKLLVRQATAAPSRKQNANLAGSQLTTILLVTVAVAAPEIYARIPPEFLPGLGSAVGGVLGFAFGYFAHERG